MAEPATTDIDLADAGDPAAEIGRIIDRPPALAPAVLRADTRLTRRWSHSGAHFSLPPMNSHVVMTYYGSERDLLWRSDGSRTAGRSRPGTVTLIPEGHDGHWDISGSIEVSHVYLTDERLQACADEIAGGKRVELLGRVGFDDPAAARILGLLSEEAAVEDASSRLFVEQAVDLLCTQLVRAHSSFGALAPAPRRGLADWQIRRVTEYMRAHLDEDIGLNELAALVNLSRFHFCTAFRLATGRTPHEWLVALRVERAKQLLKDPNLRITDIALAVGYETPSAFAAAFRKVTGTTPTDFRRQL